MRRVANTTRPREASTTRNVGRPKERHATHKGMRHDEAHDGNGFDCRLPGRDGRPESRGKAVQAQKSMDGPKPEVVLTTGPQSFAVADLGSPPPATANDTVANDTVVQAPALGPALEPPTNEAVPPAPLPPVTSPAPPSALPLPEAAPPGPDIPGPALSTAPDHWRPEGRPWFWVRHRPVSESEVHRSTAHCARVPYRYTWPCVTRASGVTAAHTVRPSACWWRSAFRPAERRKSPAATTARKCGTTTADTRSISRPSMASWWSTTTVE